LTETALEVGTVKRTRLKALTAAALGVSLLAMQIAPVIAAPKSSRTVSVTAGGLTGLGSFTISAGESFPVAITVRNDGGQTLNNVRLLVGQDNDPTTAANGDANPPGPLPSGVTATAAGCDSGSLLTCLIGQLRSKQSATFVVTFALAEGTPAATFGTKATVKVAEGGNDAGGNLDSFAIEGGLSVVPFSCARSAVYRPAGTSKDVSTCGVTDARNSLGQSARVTLPGALTTMDLQVVTGASCPSVTGVKCIGHEVDADVTGDSPNDTLRWSGQIQVSGPVNLNKLIVHHTSDNGTVTTFSLKSNACKTANAKNCGTASVSGGILTVTFQTPGNGKTRILG
jgi:hypothetical protein